MSIKHKLQVLRAHVVTLGTELTMDLKSDIHKLEVNSVDMIAWVIHRSCTASSALRGLV